MEAKKPKEDIKVSEEIKQKDSHKEELRRTCDGHYVKSDPEIIIDDILYENRIVHCYEKKVPIDSDEQTIKCDWFIPVTDARHGIYIEYWGMNTKEYLQNKEKLDLTGGVIEVSYNYTTHAYYIDKCIFCVDGFISNRYILCEHVLYALEKYDQGMIDGSHTKP